MKSFSILMVKSGGPYKYIHTIYMSRLLFLHAATNEGVDRGGGGTGVEGAESGVEGAESGWRGREAGVEGTGSGDRGGGEPGKIRAGN